MLILSTVKILQKTRIGRRFESKSMEESGAMDFLAGTISLRL